MCFLISACAAMMEVRSRGRHFAGSVIFADRSDRSSRIVDGIGTRFSPASMVWVPIYFG